MNCESMTLQITPLSIQEFSVKYKLTEKPRLIVVAQYKRYLDQNKHQHHYDGVSQSSWFKQARHDFMKGAQA